MSGHPIIALWCHPRSMSTATERIMRARGDCTCIHEPFMYYYYIHRAVRRMPHFEPDASRPTAFHAIAAEIEELAEQGPIFFKDMSYYVWPTIAAHTQLSARLINLFLIRDPRKSIPSYYRLDPAVTVEEIGIEAQWLHFEWIQGETGETPVVIEAEAIQDDPKGIMRGVWQHVGLPYLDHAFAWQAEDPPVGWAEVAGWHKDVAASSAFRSAVAESEQEMKGHFEAMAEKAPHLRAYLAHHTPFYLRLKRIAQQRL